MFLSPSIREKIFSCYVDLLYPYQGQVGTAGLDLILYVGHLSSFHPPILGVAEVTGGVNVLVKLIQRVNAQSRGIQGIIVCGAGAGGENSQQILAFTTCSLSHLLQQRCGKMIRNVEQSWYYSRSYYIYFGNSWFSDGK